MKLSREPRSLLVLAMWILFAGAIVLVSGASGQRGVGASNGALHRNDGLPGWSLGQNSPNPFCSRDTATCIPFSLSRAGNVRFCVLDYETNDTVRVLLDGSLAPGNQIICWDGRDSLGNLAPSGFYTYRLTVVVDGSVVFDSSRVATQCCGVDCHFSEVATPLVSFPSITVGDTTAAPVTLHNPFGTSITIVSSSSVGGGIFFDPAFAERLLQGIVLGPDSSVTASVYFCPLQGGVHKADIFYRSADTGDTLALTHVRGRGRPISFDWTTARFYPDRTIGAADSVVVLETMADSVEVDSMALYYAAGGSASYQRMGMSLAPDNPGNNAYLAMLPARTGGPRGLSFYVAAYNGPVVAYRPSPGNPERMRVRVDNLRFPKPEPAMTYEMISFPIEIPNNTIVGVLDDDLGGRNAALWRLYSYAPAGSKYVELPNDSAFAFDQGRGYWLITREAKMIDTAPLQAVSAPLDSAFAIRLEPGWNMIGNPFDFRVAWDSATIDDRPMARADTIVESPVGWVAGEGYSYSVGILEPFEGYWVRNLDAARHILKIPPRELPATGAPLRAERRADGWEIEIGVASQGARDLHNVVGVATGASRDWDRSDRSEPPLAPGRGISLYFPHGTWGRHAGLYSSDVRPGCIGDEWRFDVAKSSSTETVGDVVTIQFNGVEDVPKENDVYLVDRELQALVDLRTDGTYQFVLGKRDFVSSEEGARFVLLIGNEAFIGSREGELPKPPVRTTLYQNYPNPFNPSTVIRYDVAATCDTEVLIFDARGGLVRTLHRGRETPGRHEIAWNGENDGGLRVASGIYFCRLRTAQVTQTKKLIILR